MFLLIGLSLNLDGDLVGFLSVIISREIGVAALRDFSARNDNRQTSVTFLKQKQLYNFQQLDHIYSH